MALACRALRCVVSPQMDRHLTELAAQSCRPNHDHLIAMDDLMPSQLNAAARVARLSNLAAPERAWSHAQLVS